MATCDMEGQYVQVDDTSVDAETSQRGPTTGFFLGLLSAAAVVLLCGGVPGLPSNEPDMMLAHPASRYQTHVTSMGNAMQAGLGMQHMSSQYWLRQPVAPHASAKGGQPGGRSRRNARSTVTQKRKSNLNKEPVPKVPDININTPLSTVMEKQLLDLVDISKNAETVDAPRIGRYVDRLEEFYPPGAVGTFSLDGTWRLVYASTPVYRASPFSWAFSEVVQKAAAPFLAICDTPPEFRIGAVWQTIGEGSLVSAIEFEVSDGDKSSEYYRPPVRGIVKTVAQAQPDAFDPVSLILERRSTEFQDSAMPLTDSASIPIKMVTGNRADHSETSHLTTIYLSPTMHIARTHEGDALVYVKTSDYLPTWDGITR
eukprot:gnl/TRDRNA2_/TRDRNA2_193187_c0_seq1.p1 gnl/TRDRNA2_/TRDRNA2_193187_c0~~gnl/TRDRNA2_/TRDRNA2_193187_c0_seq1.p1  ORF type:complete len:393 (+),score=41.40 gnl/TRDRNA2_/TRDRNA2_193187_c0_seq1:72-1181(+)